MSSSSSLQRSNTTTANGDELLGNNNDTVVAAAAAAAVGVAFGNENDDEEEEIEFKDEGKDYLYDDIEEDEDTKKTAALSINNANDTTAKSFVSSLTNIYLEDEEEGEIYDSSYFIDDDDDDDNKEKRRSTSSDDTDDGKKAVRVGGWGKVSVAMKNGELSNSSRSKGGGLSNSLRSKLSKKSRSRGGGRGSNDEEEEDDDGDGKKAVRVGRGWGKVRVAQKNGELLSNSLRSKNKSSAKSKSSKSSKSKHSTSSRFSSSSNGGKSTRSGIFRFTANKTQSERQNEWTTMIHDHPDGGGEGGKEGKGSKGKGPPRTTSNGLDSSTRSTGGGGRRGMLSRRASFMSHGKNPNRRRSSKGNNKDKEDVDQHANLTFENWTKEEVLKALHSEPWLSRFYRQLSALAGLVQPLTEKDYEAGIKHYKSKEAFTAEFFLDNGEMLNTGFQLNNNTNFPFDAYRLFKDAHFSFLLALVTSSVIVLVAIFALVGFAGNCYDDITIGNSIPTGILLLSGLGDMVLNSEENTSVCLWMHSVAVIIGIYMMLPILGALVLVRLLDNRADLIKSSNVILLTKRNGYPTIMIRAATANGQHLSHFTSSMVVYVFNKEKDTGEAYASMTNLELSHPPAVGYSSLNLTHQCDENSPLTKMGIVSMDKDGVPIIHKERGLIGFSLFADADGAAHHCKLYLDMNKTLAVPCPDTGRIPMYESTVVTTIFDWRKTEGKSVCVNDMSKISKWKYSDIHLRGVNNNNNAIEEGEKEKGNKNEKNDNNNKDNNRNSHNGSKDDDESKTNNSNGDDDDDGKDNGNKNNKLLTKIVDILRDGGDKNEDEDEINDENDDDESGGEGDDFVDRSSLFMMTIEEDEEE